MITIFVINYCYEIFRPQFFGLCGNLRGGGGFYTSVSRFGYIKSTSSAQVNTYAKKWPKHYLTTDTQCDTLAINTV